MDKYIKNNSGSQGTWQGKVLEDQEWYLIPQNDEIRWSSDSKVLTDVLAGDLILAQSNDDTTNFTDTNLAINFIKNFPSDIDASGRVIQRQAATRKGWHYQAHSFEFEVNKLNSEYNADENGNDLGLCSMKIYKDDGQGGLTECTTQGDADVNGIKTVVKWEPDFDFEIISGNVRQASKETVDSRIYVNAVIPTGLPAPYDWLKIPFTQGGINLKYIGADEILKTDGRAAKYIPGASGAYFEVIANYAADLLTNENRHEMSLILEIYKDPTS